MLTTCWSGRAIGTGRSRHSTAIGRLPGAAALAEDVSGCLLDQGFRPLAITVADGERAGRLPGPVRDPFDRMLIAQALTLDIALVSIEQPFDRYGVRRLW